MPRPCFHSSHYEKFLATGEVKCIDDEIPFEIPEGWEWCRLGAIGSWGSGATPSKGHPEFYGGSIPWLTTGELNETYVFDTRVKVTEKALACCSLRKCATGDVLIAMYGATIGKVAIAGCELTTNQACCACTPYYNYNKYLFYFLMSNKLNFIKMGEGGAQPNISKEKIVATLCPLPPLNEQRRIVYVVESLIPKIEHFTTLQANLEELNASIFTKLRKSILQEAIQGRLVPQDPADEPASVLLERIKAEKAKLFKEGKFKKKDLVDSDIFKGDDNKYFEKVENDVLYLEDEIPFEIPETWAWVRLNDICEYIQRGKSPKYSEIKKYPVVAQKCNQWSGFSLEKALFIDPKTLPSYGQERFLQHGDLLWNSTGLGTLGRMAIYNESVNPYGVAVADSHVTVIRPIKSFINFEYLYLYFSSNEVQSVIEDKADGSTKQKELATKTIKSYLVPLPPLTEQYRIVAKYHSVASTDEPKEN